MVVAEVGVQIGPVPKATLFFRELKIRKDLRTIPRVVLRGLQGSRKSSCETMILLIGCWGNFFASVTPVGRLVAIPTAHPIRTPRKTVSL